MTLLTVKLGPTSLPALWLHTVADVQRSPDSEPATLLGTEALVLTPQNVTGLDILTPSESSSTRSDDSSYVSPPLLQAIVRRYKAGARPPGAYPVADGAAEPEGEVYQIKFTDLRPQQSVDLMERICAGFTAVWAGESIPSEFSAQPASASLADDVTEVPSTAKGDSDSVGSKAHGNDALMDSLIDEIRLLLRALTANPSTRKGMSRRAFRQHILQQHLASMMEERTRLNAAVAEAKQKWQRDAQGSVPVSVPEATASPSPVQAGGTVVDDEGRDGAKPSGPEAPPVQQAAERAVAALMAISGPSAQPLRWGRPGQPEQHVDVRAEGLPAAAVGATATPTISTVHVAAPGAGSESERASPSMARRGVEIFRRGSRRGGSRTSARPDSAAYVDYEGSWQPQYQQAGLASGGMGTGTGMALGARVHLMPVGYQHQHQNQQQQPQQPQPQHVGIPVSMSMPMAMNVGMGMSGGHPGYTVLQQPGGFIVQGGPMTVGQPQLMGTAASMQQMHYGLQPATQTFPDVYYYNVHGAGM